MFASYTGKIIATFTTNILEDATTEKELTEMEYDGLENIAGYICHKLKDDIPDIAATDCLEVPYYSWVQHLSEGGLSKPTEKTMHHIEALHQIFEDSNRQGLLIKNGYLKFHMEQARHIECDDRIKTLFFRARMFFKIRALNSNIYDNSISRKRKLSKIKT